MTAQLVQTMQALVKQTLESSKPTDYILGVVETVNPLSIRIDQRDVISKEFLILTDAVRDYDVDIEVNHVTENRAGGGGYAQYENHNHGYSGRKRIRVYNGLSPGESVIMVRQSGGQEYCVLSRSSNHANLSGQWG